MIPLLTEAPPPAAGQGARRVVFALTAAAVTMLLAWLALFLGAWAFDYRRYSAHNRRLETLLTLEPRLEQVVEAFRNEGSPLLAAPEDETALRAEAARHGAAREAAVLQTGRRFRHTRVFLAGDMVYFIFFDDAGVMRAFTCVSR